MHTPIVCYDITLERTGFQLKAPNGTEIFGICQQGRRVYLLTKQADAINNDATFHFQILHGGGSHVPRGYKYVGSWDDGKEIQLLFQVTHESDL